MQTLIPQDATATAMPLGKAGRVLGFGLTVRTLLLLAAGLVLAIPAFYVHARIGYMVAWDGMLMALVVMDGLRLPKPEAMTVRRRFLDSPQLGRPTRVELSVTHAGDGVLDVRLMDDLAAAFTAAPRMQRVEAFPREAAVVMSEVSPNERGDFVLGRVFLRYRSALGLVERWAAALPVEANGRVQGARVFPAHDDARNGTEFYLMRARQIELQRRKLQMRGIGRDFDSLRDYQMGDELRKISWTATARRGRLVTRQFTVERSQQVWAVLDAGRLSRTAFELRREETGFAAETTTEREQAHTLTVTQLDQAATAATMLAQVVQTSGDKFALMTYGRGVQQVLPPGAGAVHLRLLLDQLSHTKSEAAEADPLLAVARLKTLQRRRGLMVWITELVDSAGQPEIVRAAADLARRHLVVLVLLRHPELEALAASRPASAAGMFHVTAAQEMLERRRATIAKLERQGVLIVETTPEELGVQTVSKYLEVKAAGRL